ncbi:MAG: nucleotidyltransferase family protein [Streptosporangiaceae bacterium]
MAGVLLAAGEGSRLGQPKALILLGGQSLARRGIVLLRDGGADPVIVVTGAAGAGQLGTGPGSPDLDARAENYSPVITVHNPDWSTGMGSSLRVGLAAVPDHCTAAVLALADQPLVGAAAVRRLISAHSAGAGVAVACYDGQPRNPVLISREYWPEVAALAAGDTGARPFLRAHRDLVTEIECGDTGRPDDIDTPDDLARIVALAGTGPFPT